LGDCYSIAHEFCFGILISSLAVIRFLCLSVDTYRTDISQFLYSFRIFASHLRIAKDVALAEVDKQSILQSVSHVSKQTHQLKTAFGQDPI
jgi:hypothetical protein